MAQDALILHPGGQTTMDIEAQFDQLRQDCSAALEHFLSEAHETERRMQELTLTASVETTRQFMDQRSAEWDACMAYISSTRLVSAFLHQHLHSVQ